MSDLSMSMFANKDDFIQAQDDLIQSQQQRIEALERVLRKIGNIEELWCTGEFRTPIAAIREEAHKALTDTTKAATNNEDQNSS